MLDRRPGPWTNSNVPVGWGGEQFEQGKKSMGAAAGVRRVIRPSKKAAATELPRLEAVLQGRDCRVTLAATGREVLAGPIGAEIVVDGRLLAPTGDWEHVCTIEEPLAVYTEHSQLLENGWKLERQLLISRHDRFCFLADCLLGPAAANLRYRLQWPLAAKTRLLAGSATHEARLLLDQRRSLLALPLSFPEWRAERERCALTSTERGELQLTHELKAQRLHAALFLDLDPARSKRPCTWRRLAVAEERQPVPREVAAGYRVQVGKEQWLFYRSLGGLGNRTVLGTNLCSDFLAARFSAKGEVTTMVEIE